MSRRRLSFESFVPLPIEPVFAFFSQPRNLASLTPPERGLEIDDAPAVGSVGAAFRVRVRILFCKIAWTVRFVEWQPPHLFVDVQESGPMAYWRHEHSFLAVPGGTRVVDRIEYEPPGGLLSGLIDSLFVRRDMEALFRYRSEKLPGVLGFDASPPIAIGSNPHGT